MPEIVITNHALVRFMDRSGISTPEAARDKIRRMLMTAEPVELKPKYRVRQIMKHGFQPALYRRSGNWYFVIVGNTIKTCYQTSAERWQRADS